MATCDSERSVNDFLFEKFNNLLKYAEATPEISAIDLASAMGPSFAGKSLTLASVCAKGRAATAAQVKAYVQYLFVQHDVKKLIGDAKLPKEHETKLLRYVDCFREVCAL